MMPFQLLRTMSLFRSPGTLNTPTTLLKKEGLMREWGGMGRREAGDGRWA